MHCQKIGRTVLSSLTGNANGSRTLLLSINKSIIPLHCSHTHAASSLHFQSPLQLQHRSLSRSTVGTRFLSFQKVRALGHTSFAAQKGTRNFFSTPKLGSKENGGGQSRSYSNHHTRELETIFYKDLAKFKENVRTSNPRTARHQWVSRKSKLAILGAVVKIWEASCEDWTTNTKILNSTLKEQYEFVKIVKFVVWIDSLFEPELWTWQEREALKAESKALEYWAAKDLEWSQAVAGAPEAGDYYTHDLETLFRRELERVNGRVNDPDVPMLARMLRFAMLMQAQSEFGRWQILCGLRRTSGAKPTETRTIEEQARFLGILKGVLKRDSRSRKPLWTAQEREEMLAVEEALENQLQNDPRYSKSSVFLHFLLNLVFQACYFWDFVETLAFLNREAIDLPCSPMVELLHACVVTHSAFGIVRLIV
ncbi:hypothetical protein XANCAGTX0491_007050 [Xanthoria calcicola]